MKKPLALLSALLTAALLLVFGVLFLADPNRDALAGQAFSGTQSASQVFLPVAPRPEERIVRHPHPDGSFDDDVEMRDGTTKHIVYDAHKVLREVSAYYKGAKDGVRGPLKYEKSHNAQNHLENERHLRQDGSLEMDGALLADGTYLRHVYFPSETPIQDPRQLKVVTTHTYDYGFRHTSETTFREDGTRSQLHTWGTSADDLVTIFGADGQTVLSAEGKKGGGYYTVEYFPGGLTPKMELVNTWQGTNITWYNNDQAHSVALKVTFDNQDNDQITLMDKSGKPAYLQTWSLDWSGNPYPGAQPRVVDHIDHLNAAGKTDVRYGFDRKTHKINQVIFFQGENFERYGARVEYTVGEDGYATKVQTFDAKNNGDGGKPLTRADGKHFALDSSVTSRPQFTTPTLKEGLKLYGEPPQEEYD